MCGNNRRLGTLDCQFSLRSVSKVVVVPGQSVLYLNLEDSRLETSFPTNPVNPPLLLSLFLSLLSSLSSRRIILYILR